MLKKIMKAIGKQLLKLDRFKEAVSDYKDRQQKKRDDQLFARLMSANYSYRKAKPLNLEKDDTLGVVTLEEFRGGKVVARESMIINSTNWGGTKL